MLSQFSAKNGSRTPKIEHFHCVSEANAWASAHALSMVTWYLQNIVNGYHLIKFSSGFIIFETTNPDRDETETRLSKIKANETRPRRDTLKKFHPRRDLDKTTSRILYQTKSFCTISLETETLTNQCRSVPKMS